MTSKHIKSRGLTFGFMLLLCFSSAAQQLTPLQSFQSIAPAPLFENKGVASLRWTRSTDATVVGYRVYYGTNAAMPNTAATVGNLTNVTIKNLIESVTYYFHVTGFETNGIESKPSNQISVFIYPKLDLVTEVWRWRIRTPAGSSNVWQISTNLVNWITVQTNIGTGGIISLLRPNNGVQEFARLR